MATSDLESVRATHARRRRAATLITAAPAPFPVLDLHRQRVVNGLFPPVREVILAADAVEAAWAARDLERVRKELGRLKASVAAYLAEVRA